jgi:hypothetical protein
MKKYEWSEEICYDCGAKVGEIHKPGCKKEVCPVCGRKLIHCGHFDEIEKNKLPRIPHIQSIVVCSVCGELFPRLLKVEKEEWEKFIIPPLQRKALCRRCYDQMKELFPYGWKKVKDHPRTFQKLERLPQAKEVP